jgi:hypothetical protein
MEREMIWAASILLVCVAGLHSWLGETRILVPLLSLEPRGVLKSGRVRGILRGAWHATSLAWIALAAALIVSAGSATESAVVWTVFALASATAAGCLISWGPSHPGFIAFTLCAGMLASQRLI